MPLIIAIPEALREKLGPEGAHALAELLAEAGVQIRGDVIEIAASRYERQLAELGAALRSEIASLRSEMHSEIGALRVEMRATEARITRWMFVFWLGQTAVLLGIVFVFRP